ncbi:hypothetical protein KY289_004054 [Solanum tuberosum]|nr:hypothetical protein KY289_004054 [Solanum tuberosum]
MKRFKATSSHPMKCTPNSMLSLIIFCWTHDEISFSADVSVPSSLEFSGRMSSIVPSPSQIIKCNGIGHKLNKVDDSPSGSKDAHTEYDKELFAVSMRRFLYIRCYDSFEFLATLKTLHFQLQKEKEAHGSGVYLLMIDSIGAFYWMDRASPSIPPGSNNRRSLSLQSVSDIAVQEIQKILVVHPMLVLTTKAASLQDKFTSREVIRSTGQLSVESNLDSRTIRSSTNAQLYREYMPSVWQSFVSHRILVRPDSNEMHTILRHVRHEINPEGKPQEQEWRESKRGKDSKAFASSGNLREDDIHLLSTSQCK